MRSSSTHCLQNCIKDFQVKATLNWSCLDFDNSIVIVLSCFVYHQCREVYAEHLRTSFKNIDPSLDSETLDWNLSVAFQTNECELQAQALNTEVVLQRLSAANVNRAGPKWWQLFCQAHFQSFYSTLHI